MAVRFDNNLLHKCRERALERKIHAIINPEYVLSVDDSNIQLELEYLRRRKRIRDVEDDMRRHQSRHPNPTPVERWLETTQIGTVIH